MNLFRLTVGWTLLLPVTLKSCLKCRSATLMRTAPCMPLRWSKQNTLFGYQNKLRTNICVVIKSIHTESSLAQVERINQRFGLMLEFTLGSGFPMQLQCGLPTRSFLNSHLVFLSLFITLLHCCCCQAPNVMQVSIILNIFQKYLKRLYFSILKKRMSFTFRYSIYMLTTSAHK